MNKEIFRAYDIRGVYPDELNEDTAYRVGRAIVQYSKKTKISDDISITLKDAGHIIGSSMFEIFIRKNNQKLKIVATGDFGNKYTPLLREPAKKLWKLNMEKQQCFRGQLGISLCLRRNN